jgi:hypothetical protein
VIGTTGGILVAWNENAFIETSCRIGQFSITMDLQNVMDGSVFRFTVVYGPSQQANGHTFFQELCDAKTSDGIPWMVTGDLNVTLHIKDRSNQNQNINQMRLFRSLIDFVNLIDLPLNGRNYTWSNERNEPTFVRLDRFFISTEWSRMFPNSMQITLPNTSSDHCPLLCECRSSFPTPNFFKFENFWLCMGNFKEMVMQA